MAKVLNPFYSADARGSVAGFTASRNRSGANIRQKSSPVQPRTNATQLVRYELQALTSQFQQLTAAQIDAWNDFADSNPVTDVFGNSILLTGLNWFVRLNSRLTQAGQSAITTPPPTGNADFSPTINAFYTSGTGMQFSFSAVPATDEKIWVQYSGNVPLSRNFLSRDTRQRLRIDNTDTSPVTLVDSADLILDTSQRHVTAFAVDGSGRATPKQRWSVRPTSPP